jgi:hypothetical protein
MLDFVALPGTRQLYDSFYTNYPMFNADVRHVVTHQIPLIPSA